MCSPTVSSAVVLPVRVGAATGRGQAGQEARVALSTPGAVSASPWDRSLKPGPLASLSAAQLAEEPDAALVLNAALREARD